MLVKNKTRAAGRLAFLCYRDYAGIGEALDQSHLILNRSLKTSKLLFLFCKLYSTFKSRRTDFIWFLNLTIESVPVLNFEIKINRF